MSTGILEFLTVFVLAGFVGIEVINAVPSILHTPLMSGSNAIHGIVLVGTILIMGSAHGAVADHPGLLRRAAGHPQHRRWLRGHRPHAGDVQDQAGRAVEEGRRQRRGRSDRRCRVTLNTWIDLVYLLAAVGFILALKGLSSPKHARNGNLLAAAAAALAVGFTFAYPSVRAHSLNLVLTLVAMAIGAAVAVPAARKVKMTAMPQMVAIFNGVGGGAAALVSIVVFLIEAPAKPAVYRIAEVLFGVLVGCVSFAGSAIAFAKLQELMTGRPVTYPAQQVINAIVAVAIVALAVATLVTGSVPLLVATALLSLVLGVIFVLPIGGADVPVLISLLNSFTGLAVAASGFTLDNNLLIIAGTLVGASGILLTRMMSKAMGRSLANVLFSAFGSVVTAAAGAPTAPARPARSGRARPRTSGCCWPTPARW